MDAGERNKIIKQITQDKNIFSIVKPNKASIENLNQKSVKKIPYFEWEVEETIRFLNDGDSVDAIKKKISKKRAYYKKQEVNKAKAQDTKKKLKEPTIEEQKKSVLKKNVKLQGFNVKNTDPMFKKKDRLIANKTLYKRYDNQQKTIKDLSNADMIKILGKPTLILGPKTDNPTFLCNFIAPYPKYDGDGVFGIPPKSKKKEYPIGELISFPSDGILNKEIKKTPGMRRDGKLSEYTKYDPKTIVYFDREWIPDLAFIVDDNLSTYNILQKLVTYGEDEMVDTNLKNDNVPQFFKHFLGVYDIWDADTVGDRITFEQQKQYYELSMYVVQKIRNYRFYKSDVVEEVYPLNRYKVQYDWEKQFRGKYCDVKSKYREPEEIQEDPFHTWTIGGSDAPLGGFRTFSPTMVIKWGTKTYRPMMNKKLIEHSGKASEIGLSELPKWGSMKNFDHVSKGRYNNLKKNNKSDYNYKRVGDKRPLLKNKPEYIYNANGPHATILENRGTINMEVYERVKNTYINEHTLYPWNRPSIDKIIQGKVYYGGGRSIGFDFKDPPQKYYEWFDEVFGNVAVYDDQEKEGDDKLEQDKLQAIKDGIQKQKDDELKLKDEKLKLKNLKDEEIKQMKVKENKELKDFKFVHWLFKVNLKYGRKGKNIILPYEDGTDVVVGTFKEEKEEYTQKDINFDEYFRFFYEYNSGRKDGSGYSNKNEAFDLLKFIVHADKLLEENWDPKLWEAAGGQSIKKLDVLMPPREMWSISHQQYYEVTDETDWEFTDFTKWINDNTGLQVRYDYINPSLKIDWKTMESEPAPWHSLNYRFIRLDAEDNQYYKRYNKELHAIGVEFYLYQEFLLEYNGEPTIGDLHNIELDYKPPRVLTMKEKTANTKYIDLLAPPTQEQNEKFKAMKKAQKDAKNAKKAKAKQKKKDKEAQFFKDLQEEEDLFEGL